MEYRQCAVSRVGKMIIKKKFLKKKCEKNKYEKPLRVASMLSSKSKSSKLVNHQSR